jgi:elongation factor P--(R)-beta-lysine ligase
VPPNWRLTARRQALAGRATIIHTIRSFFQSRGYLEVETPYRIPAPAPEVHIDATPSGPWFLHPSPELCMKRLLAAGYERIFQICRVWREGERGRRHTPEFTLLEWYRAHAGYRDVMEECRALVEAAAASLGVSRQISFQGKTISLAGPWDRVTVREAFLSHGGISMEEALENGSFDQVMVEAIEPALGNNRPAFLLDYPAERGSLARLRPDDPTVAERFEFYIAGVELANAFSELTDPGEQRGRFEAEEALRRSLGKAHYPMPEKFLAELPFMPPSAGIALGVDRLAMILLNSSSIDEVMAFTPEEL